MFDDALSIRYVRALVDGVEHRGFPQSRFLEVARWDPRELFAVEGRVRCSEYARLSELALDVTRDPALGLRVLECVQRDSVDLVGQLVAYSASVRDALEGLIQLYKLLGDECRFELIEDDREVTLRYARPQGLSPRASRFLAELHIAGSLQLLRHFAWQARAHRVYFEHAAPDYRAEYARVFSGSERFDQPLTGIVFDRGLMDASRPFQDGELHRALRELADARVLRIARGACCADRVRDFLAAHPAPGKATMEETAQGLDLSARSLRRRLAAEGTCYEAVATEALITRAHRLLSVEERTIEETAYALGYSEPSAFHRAFKRWTGTTPRSWRNGGR